jgi:transcription elongation factor Elf1
MNKKYKCVHCGYQGITASTSVTAYEVITFSVIFNCGGCRRMLQFEDRSYF